MSQFRFGWAKPVPVNPMNLRNPRIADIWISAAGPISNIGLAISAGILFRVIELLSGLPPMFGQMLTYAVWINCTLAFFNLIPVFPLDGSHILRNLLPPESQRFMESMDRMGPFILLLLMISGSLWYILGPPVSIMAQLILG